MKDISTHSNFKMDGLMERGVRYIQCSCFPVRIGSPCSGMAETSGGAVAAISCLLLIPTQGSISFIVQICVARLSELFVG